MKHVIQMTSAAVGTLSVLLALVFAVLGERDNAMTALMLGLMLGVAALIVQSGARQNRYNRRA